MCYMILLGAMFFGYFLAVSRVPNELATLILDLHVNAYVVLVSILLIMILLGCFMDSMAIVLLTVPIFFPVSIPILLFTKPLPILSFYCILYVSVDGLSTFLCRPIPLSGHSIERSSGGTVHSVPPRGVFVRIFHENPETIRARKRSPAA